MGLIRTKKSRIKQLKEIALKQHPHLKNVIDGLSIETLIYHLPDHLVEDYKHEFNIE